MFQMFLQKGNEELNLNSTQMGHGNAVQQGGTLNMQGQVRSAGPLQNSIKQQHAVQPQSQQQALLEQSTALSQVGSLFISAVLLLDTLNRLELNLSDSVFFFSPSLSAYLSICSLNKIHCLCPSTTP